MYEIYVYQTFVYANVVWYIKFKFTKLMMPLKGKPYDKKNEYYIFHAQMKRNVEG